MGLAKPNNNNCRFLLIVVLMNMIMCVRSEVYTVGDEQGWNSDTNFDSWSREHFFTVGDILVFKYVKEQHNVYEVKEETYRSCNTSSSSSSSSGVIAKYESGKDEVKLSEQKKYWFICNVVGHCLGGMRFNIDVMTTNSTPNGNGPPPPPYNLNSSPTTIIHTCPFFISLLPIFIHFYSY